MIFSMKKLLFLGGKKHLDAFFAKAQKQGILEFIGASTKIEDPELESLSQAIKILKKRQVILKQTFVSSKDPLSLSKEVLKTKEELGLVAEKKRELSMEASRIGVFGNFSIEDKEFIENEGKRVFQYFAMKSSKVQETTLPEGLYFVGSEYDLDYFVGVHKERKNYPGMIELFIEKPLGKIQKELEEFREKENLLEESLRNLTSYLEFLRKDLVQRLNTFHLHQAKKKANYPLSSLFAVEAWLPSNKESILQEMISSFPLFYEEVPIGKEEKIPTYMENQKASKMGEDLVKVYDTPSDEDIDPSPWVFWFFALFFAMIVSDAGYGFLYLGLALFLKWKFPFWKGALKRFSNLILTISVFCISWGVLTGSFFGIQFSVDSPFRKVSLIHFLSEKKVEYHFIKKDDVYQKWVQKYPTLQKEKNPAQILQIASSTNAEGRTKYEMLEDFEGNILMEIALFVGVMHLMLAFFRNVKKNPAGIGWVLFMIGGYLFFPYILNATTSLHFLGIISKARAEYWGLYTLYTGMGLAVVFALIQQKLKGAFEIMNVVQVFADVLSYLRLYALALAGMIVASTFNDIGKNLGFFGIFVVIVGHSTNIILGIMSGVIHGLRLNFLEWYRYCFEGGGKFFNPLRFITYKRG